MVARAAERRPGARPPADGNTPVVGEDHETGQEGLHRGQAARTPASDEGPLRQLAQGDEGDGRYLPGEPAGQVVRGPAAQECGGDVGVEDDEAHALSARREE
ncbi:hypothetical protein GCM10010210_41260 [Pseudonocardia hydrocarbonoxydans]